MNMRWELTPAGRQELERLRREMAAGLTPEEEREVDAEARAFVRDPRLRAEARAEFARLFGGTTPTGTAA